MSTVRISGVINTLNESSNIRYALGSLLPWCDEVIVMDQHSEDGTAAIAAQMGARVFQHERTGFVEAARASAVDQTTGDWIIILDADEMVPAPLARRLGAMADDDEPVDAVRVPVVNIMLGRWTRYGRWWPGYKPRFFRRGSLVLSVAIHAGIAPTPGARVVELEARKELALWHFSYHSVSDMVEKANRYSTVEATQRATRRRRRPSAIRAFRAGVMRTWREYLLGRGYRDGWVGMTVAFSRSFYRYIEKVKQWDEPQVPARVASYACAKARLLDGYGLGLHVPDDDGATEPQATEDARPTTEDARRA